MKLEESVLCVNCNEVFFAGNRCCPRCFNKQILRLDKLLEANATKKLVEDIPKNCDGCHYLRPSEQEQLESAEIHKCTLHGYTLYHFDRHPNIPRPGACTKSYKKRED